MFGNFNIYYFFMNNLWKPFFINEDWVHWFINKNLTSECSNGSLPKLNAVAFDTYKKVDWKLKQCWCVLVEKWTQKILHSSIQWKWAESVYNKIYMIRWSKHLS